MGETHLRCNAKVLFDVSTKKKNLFSFASGKTQQVTPRFIPWNKLFFFLSTLLTDVAAVPSELYLTWRNISIFLLTQIMLL